MAEARREKSIRRRLRTLLGVGVSALALAALAAPAQAAQGIEDFTTTMSTPQAGGHPDLLTSFSLESPGSPEVAKDITINAPVGVFGNPSAVTQCASVDFGLDQCPPNAQAGLITIRANYGGDPDKLLGTAPVYSVEPGVEEAARFSFIVPMVKIPISIPVTIRSASDYGMRFTVSGITQLTPVGAVDLTDLGLPGADGPRRRIASRRARRAIPPAVPASPMPAASRRRSPSSLPIRPLTGNPSICTGEALPTSIEVRTYRDPSNASRATSSYPPITDCDRPTYSPTAHAELTTAEADAPSGLDLRISARQTLGTAASPSQIRSAIMTLPEGLTINPDAADGQSACSDADAQDRPSKARPPVPTTRRSERSRSARPRSRRRSAARSTSANRSRGTSTGC